ncbi:MAG TPA: hypothetical protein VK514_13190 [Candidatus Acidoferrum sp.]|nr:hypothetical protein [Candidatus Acidoferrum sp.]
MKRMALIDSLAIGEANREREARRVAAERSFQRVARASSAKRDSGLVIAAYLAVRPDGRLVQLSLPGMPPVDLPTRGDCEGMSEDSQRRLLVMLHSLKRSAGLPVMMSLTFPEEIKLTAEEAKDCRRAFEKRMKRQFGDAWCAIWRMEAHPQMSARLGRVHPHFHMLTWGAFYDFDQLGKDWQQCVWEVLEIDPYLADGEGRMVALKHRAAGTNCERVRKWEGVIYCAKTYLAKAEEYPLGKAGRVWGYCNRESLPLAAEQRIPLTSTEASIVRMEVEAWMKERRIVSEHLVCTFFDDDPASFVARLMRNVFPRRWRATP